MLKSYLLRAGVTHDVLDYEGSCAIDGEWLDLSGIREYEQIQSYNVDNGERFTTYAIRGEEGSRMISVNGAAAHKAKVGDRVIICAYAHYSEAELANFKPRMLYMAPGNELSHTSNAVPVQEIGRAHVCTPVTNAHLVCRLLLAKKISYYLLSFIT